MTEEWRTPIYDGETYEDFEVSNLGRIKSLNYGRTGKSELLKLIEIKNGYLQVKLSKNGKKKRCYVHRLVAQTFLPNPENKPCINHKIEGKKGKTMNMVFFNEDGSIDKERTSIEWVTYKENNNYGTRTERTSKPVIQLSLTGDFIREWPSTAECERNGFYSSNVSACCNGKLPHYKGFRFMYAEDYREKQFKELGYITPF